jgi:hypothetical protein
MDDRIPKSPPRHSKKVSFSLPQDAPLHIPTSEPIIRPDSPTLGFDDGFYHSCISSPTPPEDLSAPSPFKFQEIELPLPTIMEQHEQEEEEERREEEDNNINNTYDEYDEKAAYHVARSVDRCCEHLAHLRAQLARHSTSLDQLLQTQTQTQARLSPNNRYSVKAPPPATANNATSTTTTTEKPPMPRGSEARAQDRQARVERLRKTGWQRRRFDASPYEALCEAVLAEMA